MPALVLTGAIKNGTDAEVGPSNLLPFSLSYVTALPISTIEPGLVPLCVIPLVLPSTGLALLFQGTQTQRQAASVTDRDNRLEARANLFPGKVRPGVIRTPVHTRSMIR